MNLGGKPLMSRGTIASARALMILSISVILTTKLEVDTSSLEFLGISVTSEQLNNGLFFVLLFLFVSHVINWIGDLSSLGKWNSGLVDLRHRALTDVGSKPQGQVEILITRINEQLDDEEKDVGGAEQRKRRIEALRGLKDDLKALEASRWIHSSVATFYLLVWYFAIPVLFFIWAGSILCL